MDVITALSTRKSVRSYVNVPVESELIKLIVRCAGNSPVGRGKYENYHITVVENKGALEEINNAAKKVTNFDNCTYGAPALLIVSAKHSDEADLFSEYITAGCIIQSLTLAAHSVGLASVCLLTVIKGMLSEPAIIAKLHISDGFIPIAAVAIGYSETKPATEKDIPRHAIGADII
ncbi:MAG: nitroreductase family protein [Mycoplasmataceae bacterium]|jgi:nitroreductase|nr:nitroreductase family protein [Mycoplasmataceae bacterium]